MAEINKHAAGSFCWIELNTTDAPAAKQFYSALFDWEPVDMPVAPGMVYTIMRIRGRDVAALCEMMPGQKQSGMPAHWMTYVAVESADAAAQKAVELGGQQIMLHTVGDAGRLAVLQDGQGAYFSVWQPGANPGIGLNDEPGTLCWSELWTLDRSAAANFYGALFGWRTKAGSAGAPNDYTEWQNGEQSIGGMLAITEEMGPVPPHWLPYFMVADCDATCAKAVAAGAAQCMAPMDIPGVGRFGVLRDPQGGTFAVIKVQMPS